MSCDVGEVTESLENEHSSFWFSKLSVTSPTSQLILQPFPRFTYVTTHSPTLPLIHLRHSLFSNPSLAVPTSQLILQPFRCFTYVTVHSPTLLSLLLRHRIFTYVTWRAPISSCTYYIVSVRYIINCLASHNVVVLPFLRWFFQSEL